MQCHHHHLLLSQVHPANHGPITHAMTKKQLCTYKTTPSQPGKEKGREKLEKPPSDLARPDRQTGGRPDPLDRKNRLAVSQTQPQTQAKPQPWSENHQRS
ncbi:hypothetical protein VTJ04DRAFT_4577 [Mycothermus thermophilus]|uniref:uncharacterized protein n=1 Tax=Humicola insolens TaxID=85995 RepID=UPI003741F78A